MEMPAVNLAIWLISLVLGITSTVISYRKKLWNRHINLVYCLVLLLTLFVCIFYRAIFHLIRANVSEETFLAIRQILRILLLADAGVRAVLETFGLALSVCAVFVTILTGCAAFAAGGEKECEERRGDRHGAVNFSAAGKKFSVIYLEYCCFIL